MKRKRTLLWLGVAALCALIVGATASAQRSATAKVALVTDIGGLNDKGFNHLSYVGLQRAQKQLTTAGGVNGRVFITNSANDRKPNLQTAALGFSSDQVVLLGCGVEMIDEYTLLLGTVALQRRNRTVGNAAAFQPGGEGG